MKKANPPSHPSTPSSTQNTASIQVRRLAPGEALPAKLYVLMEYPHEPNRNVAYPVRVVGLKPRRGLVHVRNLDPEGHGTSYSLVAVDSLVVEV